MDSVRIPSSSTARSAVPYVQYQNGYGKPPPQPPYPNLAFTTSAPSTTAPAASASLAAPQAGAGGSAFTAEISSGIYIRDYPHRAIAIASGTHALILRHSPATAEAGAGGHPAGHYPGAMPMARSSRDGGSGSTGAGGAAIKAMVEFIPRTRHLLDSYRPLTYRPVFGTLGLIAVEGEPFLCVVTQATRCATVRPGENVERIGSTAFFSLSSAEWDDVTALDGLEQDGLEYGGTAIAGIGGIGGGGAGYGQGLRRREIAGEHPCHALQKLLSSGSFYYSTDFDITNRCQDRPADGASFDIENMNDSFLWNGFLIDPLLKFRSHLLPHERAALDASRFLTLATRGFCRSIAVPRGVAPLGPRSAGVPSSLTVISRLSCRRAGTRFLSRGIDDDGNVANFVETETTYWSPSGTLFSYAQVRGSVPVFWEQATDMIPGRQNITITRSRDGAQPAFDLHLAALSHRYGAVHAIDLLSETKPSEAGLSQLFRYGVQHCPLSSDGGRDHALLRLSHFDFHAETRGPAGYEAATSIGRHVGGSSDGFAYYLAEEVEDDGDYGTISPAGGRGASPSRGGPGARTLVVLQQEGVFRTNCLDCLDRTNLIQSILSRMAVENLLRQKGAAASADFWIRHSTLWADNGDALSKIYAGTGALKTSFTRHGKSSLAGTLADMRKSVQRLYQNNFVDPGRQAVIDMLLGRLIGQTPVFLFDPISDFVSVELHKRRAEFLTKKDIKIHVGTFNVNGRTEGIGADLEQWLCPYPDDDEQPDIVAVGFQEIVELSPQHIMSTDPSHKALWEQAVKQTLNRRARAGAAESYVLLRSGQLVGTALCVFVRASALLDIKNVEGSVKKTGLSGMAGNKGAVAIRMDYANTSICFVTGHLAAGFANYDERNRDFEVINSGLRFQRNRCIDDHNSIIWMGDFNYRIGLSREVTKGYLRDSNMAALFENDQLNLQMVAGLAFPHYSEARIMFPPTYKFDIGTDDYDTSEKARIPAWTDRILRKGSNLRQIGYSYAPGLRISDHKAVYATFYCAVSVVDEQARRLISEDLYRRRKAEVGDSTAHENWDGSTDDDDLEDDDDDDDLVGYGAVESGLPPSSSDRSRWWLDSGRPARSEIAQPSGMVLNPGRPSNPFVPTDEGDWVSVTRSAISSESPPDRPAVFAIAGPVPVKPGWVTVMRDGGDDYDGGGDDYDGCGPATDGAATTPIERPTSLYQRPVMARASTAIREPTAIRLRTATMGPETGAAKSRFESALPPSPRRMTARPDATKPALPPRASSDSSSSAGRQASSQKLLRDGAPTPPPVARKPAHLSAGSGPAAKPAVARRPLPPQTVDDLLFGPTSSSGEDGVALWPSLMPSAQASQGV